MTTQDALLGLSGERIWVVGAGGGGIGTAVCHELTQAGAHVVAVDRSEESLRPTLEACAQMPGRIEAHRVDATNREEMERFAQEVTAQDGAPHGLVNIVGGLGRDQFGAILSTDDATVDAILQRNLRAAWLSSQLFARAASRESAAGGAIVHLASIAALQGLPFGAGYAMAKAALVSLGRTQALEWGSLGIRVNTLAAGTITTPRATPTDDAVAKRTLPLGRRGTPHDIAAAALFLLSDLSRWITGQVLAVDGGASIKPSYLDDQGLAVFVEDPELRNRLFSPPESET